MQLVDGTIAGPLGTGARRAALLGGVTFPLRELVVAPMVDQSELAFRMLCRKYGAVLCYTPMLHARLFAESRTYRKQKFSTCPEDRPLIVQFCGNEKDTLLRAALHVAEQCEAVDLNLGCPQGIARKGRYGAFLLEEWDLLAGIVSHLSHHLPVPVTCKIRMLPTLERTLGLARLLEDAGCSLLTVHGRTKEQKGEQVGACNWSVIRAVKEALRIPVIANGGVGTFAEGQRCLQETGADAVMSSEAILENPAWVAGMQPMPTPTGVALDYLEMVELYPDTRKVIKAHMFKFLHGMLGVHTDALPFLARRFAKHSMPAYIEYLREGILRLEAQHHADDDGGARRCLHPRCCQHNGYYPWYDRHRRQNPDLHVNADGAAPPDIPPAARAHFQQLRIQRRLRRIED